MSASVNLVPIAQSLGRRRVRRRNAWLVVCSVTAVLVAGGGTVQWATRSALARVTAHVSGLEAQRAETQRRLAADAARRGQLLERLQTVAAARRPQPWAERLLRLAAEAPETVFLTNVNVGTTVLAPAGTAPPAALLPAAGAAPEKSRLPAAAQEFQSMRVLGYALDHGALLQMLSVLQQLPGCRKVELIRAALEPFRTGQAIAFEFDCRTEMEP